MFSRTNEVIVSYECLKCRSNEDVLLDRWTEIKEDNECPFCLADIDSIKYWEKTETGTEL